MWITHRNVSAELDSSMDTGFQKEAIAFLSNPASYGRHVATVDVIETHISIVFLAGDRAYKLKRAVKFPYLDFSTPAQRQRACDAELTLNRRTAPDLYLEVRGIARHADGTLGWAGDGETAGEWVVVMQRFDQEQLLDCLAREEGRLGTTLILELIAHIVDFHARAEPRPDAGGAAAMAAIEAENDDCLQRFGEGLFALEHITELHSSSQTQISDVAGILNARRAAGKVRRCHGDLHLRNICVYGGKPVLFDCLEFSEEFASIDILYDLAFLLMDLEYRGLPDLANLAANRYLDLSNEDDGLATLPLFLSLRAAIRAHVTAASAKDRTAGRAVSNSKAEARGYLELARQCLTLQPNRLIAVGGVSATGKSTLAHRLAPLLGIRPGARLLRSDVIRKGLCGVQPETPLPPSAYGSGMSERVYDTIRQKAAVALRAGYCVIIDAVALGEEDRRSFGKLAADAGVPFTGVLASRIRPDASRPAARASQRRLRCNGNRPRSTIALRSGCDRLVADRSFGPGNHLRQRPPGARCLVRVVRSYGPSPRLEQRRT